MHLERHCYWVCDKWGWNCQWVCANLSVTPFHKMLSHHAASGIFKRLYQKGSYELKMKGRAFSPARKASIMFREKQSISANSNILVAVSAFNAFIAHNKWFFFSFFQHTSNFFLSFSNAHYFGALLFALYFALACQGKHVWELLERRSVCLFFSGFDTFFFNNVNNTSHSCFFFSITF